MFCPECGSENPDDARFCGSCGMAFNTAQQPVTDAPEPVARMVERDATPPAVSAGLKWGILGASLLVPLIGVVMGTLYMLKGENEDKKGVGRLWLFASVGIAFFYFLLSSAGF